MGSEIADGRCHSSFASSARSSSVRSCPMEYPRLYQQRPGFGAIRQPRRHPATPYVRQCIKPDKPVIYPLSGGMSRRPTGRSSARERCAQLAERDFASNPETADPLVEYGSHSTTLLYLRSVGGGAASLASWGARSFCGITTSISAGISVSFSISLSAAASCSFVSTR